MNPAQAIRGRLESAARPIFHRLRGTLPGALRMLGLPEGAHATIDDWARSAARKPGEGVAFLCEREIRNDLAVTARHLPGDEHPSFSAGLIFIDLRTFVATLRDSKVTGRNGYVVASDNRVLGDVPRVYRARYEPRRHPLLDVVRPPRVERLAGRSAVLSLFSVGNYYHWLFEGLPRLALLEQAGFDLAAIDWFIVNETDNQFVAPSLARFGIPESKLRVSRDGHAWECAELLVPSMPCCTNPSQWVCDWLRGHLRPAHAVSGGRLFVSRLPGGRRRLVNEVEVEALLAARGFRKIYLENCTFAEQIALFSGAEAVVAAHGASMANLIFCPPGARAIELFNPQYVNPCYWSVAVRAGLDYGYLLGEGSFTENGQDIANCGDDIAVGPGKMRQLLDLFRL